MPSRKQKPSRRLAERFRSALIVAGTPRPRCIAVDVDEYDHGLPATFGVKLLGDGVVSELVLENVLERFHLDAGDVDDPVERQLITQLVMNRLLMYAVLRAISASELGGLKAMGALWSRLLRMHVKLAAQLRDWRRDRGAAPHSKDATGEDPEDRCRRLYDAFTARCEAVERNEIERERAAWATLSPDAQAAFVIYERTLNAWFAAGAKGPTPKKPKGWRQYRFCHLAAFAPELDPEELADELQSAANRLVDQPASPGPVSPILVRAEGEMAAFASKLRAARAERFRRFAVMRQAL
jgi:hypothetical protein